MRSYRGYLLTVLMAILAFSYVDRMVFAVALEEIKIDLHLSDTQLGVLNGVVFALFFSAMGVPIARWTDRGNRIAIVSVVTGVWSLTVALCAAAGSFLHFLFLRIGTAAGEAGCLPSANSLIPDYFDRVERPRAVSRYMLGVPIGLTVGYFVGGWLNELFGWRITFLVIGVPGLALAALAMLTLREPRRGWVPVAAAASNAPGHPQPTLREVAARLGTIPTLRRLIGFYLVWYFSGWALVQWQPTFFIRSHGMTTGELGTWLALAYGAGGLLGTWLGGEVSTRLAAGNERLQLQITAAVFSLVALLYVAVQLVPSRFVALVALGLTAIGSAVANGPLFATIQTLVPARMRATAVALVAVFPTFIGMGLGPLTAGVLSDFLRRWTGNESLRYSLLAFCPGFAWAAWHLWRASRTVSHDVAGAQANAGDATSPTMRSEVHAV